MTDHIGQSSPPRSMAPAPQAARARDSPGAGAETAAALVLGAVALLVTGTAVFVTAISRIAPHPVEQATVLVVVCVSFVAAGIIALRREPYSRFGWLLVAVGLASQLTVLHDANTAFPYTIGVFTSNLVFAVLVHAVLAFPSGRLDSRGSRLLVVVAYVDVLALQALAILFDPLTRWRSDHPRNLALVDSHISIATTLEALESGIAIALALAVAAVLARRVRAATPAARRQLVPVLWCGSGGLLVFAVGLAVAPVSSEAGIIGVGVGLLASVALPVAFLGVVLQGRLSRAAVGELLVELREGTEETGLRDALRRALDDPSLELARRQPDGTWVDSSGHEIALPGAGEPCVATPIEHKGHPVGALLHDRSLRLRPELLDGVSAAAGFALANERVLAKVRQVEARNGALLYAIPDLMFRIARDGTYLDVRADDPSGLVAPPGALIGRNVRDVLPPDVTDAVISCVERALESGAISSVEYELTIDSDTRLFESRMVPSGESEVVTIVRDFTEQRRADEELRRLAEEQAALRRVATLVAGDVPPEVVFQAVTEEVCRLLGIPTALLERFDSPESATIVGRFGDMGDFEVGTVLPLQEGMAVHEVLRTGASAHVDSYDSLGGEIAERVHALGVQAAIAVPINVAGTTWGAIIASLREGESLPPETESRMQAFAELVALGVASADARDELAESRLRIIETADAERRRLERNLHDGAQQRLVAISVGLQLARAKLRDSPDEAERLIAFAADDLAHALTELRELAQGIHPAVLTDRGLATALEVLAARTPLPVALELELPERLPERVEAAAYYVVSEALANVVKHADAHEACVRIDRDDGLAVIEVSDDGTGSVDPDGSGLRGLRDRVETLDGQLVVEGRPGTGTRIRAQLPASP